MPRFFNYFGMGAGYTKEMTSYCCRVCNCLGYCVDNNHEKTHYSSLKVIPNCRFDDFESSANRGCLFCAFVLQSFVLLQSQQVGRSTPVELLLYPDSPAELHSLADEDVYDVVEIYPYPCKPTYCLTYLWLY